MGTPAALLLCASLYARSALAGPPFQTDDPVPVEHRHYEVYVFGILGRTPAATALLAPASEFNWGAVPDLQVHVMAFEGTLFAGGTSASGFGDVEAGAKYRFLNETASRPQIAVYPVLEFPTGDRARGLGNGPVVGAPARLGSEELRSVDYVRRGRRGREPGAGPAHVPIRRMASTTRG